MQQMFCLCVTLMNDFCRSLFWTVSSDSSPCVAAGEQRSARPSRRQAISDCCLWRVCPLHLHQLSPRGGNVPLGNSAQPANNNRVRLARSALWGTAWRISWRASAAATTRARHLQAAGGQVCSIAVIGRLKHHHDIVLSVHYQNLVHYRWTITWTPLQNVAFPSMPRSFKALVLTQPSAKSTSTL